MPRIHQVNQAQYKPNTEHELLLSLQKGDAIILIEEAVLRLIQHDTLIRHTQNMNIKVYALEQDLKSYGINKVQIDSINTEKWLQLTAEFDQHTAW